MTKGRWLNKVLYSDLNLKVSSNARSSQQVVFKCLSAGQLR